MSDFDFTGKVVLVTGSSRGIGAEMIKAFGKHGAQCVVNYVADYGAEVDQILKAQQLYYDANTAKSWNKAYSDFINSHYQLWGRKLHVDMRRGPAEHAPHRHSEDGSLTIHRAPTPEDEIRRGDESRAWDDTFQNLDSAIRQQSFPKFSALSVGTSI